MHVCAVWQCVDMHQCMRCVCVVCGRGCVGGLWGVWMGHGGVVADSPHPHHGHLWCVLVEVVGGSCGKCCEGVGACVSGAAACCGVRHSRASAPVLCGARRGQIRAPPGLGRLLRAPPARRTVSSGVWNQWGSLPHLFLLAAQHATVAAGVKFQKSAALTRKAP